MSQHVDNAFARRQQLLLEVGAATLLMAAQAPSEASVSAWLATALMAAVAGVVWHPIGRVGLTSGGLLLIGGGGVAVLVNGGESMHLQWLVAALLVTGCRLCPEMAHQGDWSVHAIASHSQMSLLIDHAVGPSPRLPPECSEAFRQCVAQLHEQVTRLGAEQASVGQQFVALSLHQKLNRWIQSCLSPIRQRSPGMNQKGAV